MFQKRPLSPPEATAGSAPPADRPKTEDLPPDAPPAETRLTRVWLLGSLANADKTLFNDAWIPLALVCLLVGMATRQSGLTLLGVLLLTVLPLARLWNHLALHRVLYVRRLIPRRAFIGETVDLVLTVENRKLLPLGWLKVEDEWPEDLPLTTGQEDLHPALTTGRLAIENCLSLRWYERVRLRYTIRCEKRGFFRLGPARLSSGDLFGLFRSECALAHLDWLIIYPRVLPIDELGLPAKDPFGEIKARERMFEDPARTIGVRDYFPGDSFRRIHWKATARRQELQAKVYEPTTSFTMMVFLNVATLEKFWMGTIPDLLERCISVAASVSSYAVEHRYVTGLMANGSVPHSDQPIKVLPGRDPQQLTRILEALAAVTPVATADVERLLIGASPRLPWGATLVVVTAIVTADLVETLLRLHNVGRRLVLISLAKQAPDPLISEQILTYHLPDAASPYYPLQTTAAQQLNDASRRDAILARWSLRAGGRPADPGTALADVPVGGRE